MNDNLLTELAIRRLDSDIDNGLNLYHPFILKPCPPKKSCNKVMECSWCPDCKNWAWALGGVCATKYNKELDRRLERLRGK